MSNTQRNIFQESEADIEWAGLEHGCRRILKGFFFSFLFFLFLFPIGLVVSKRFRFRIFFWKNLLQMMSSLAIVGEFFLGYSIFDTPFCFFFCCDPNPFLGARRRLRSAGEILRNEPSVSGFPWFKLYSNQLFNVKISSCLSKKKGLSGKTIERISMH